jgi:hypothetical protein
MGEHERPEEEAASEGVLVSWDPNPFTQAQVEAIEAELPGGTRIGAVLQLGGRRLGFPEPVPVGKEESFRSSLTCVSAGSHSPVLAGSHAVGSSSPLGPQARRRSTGSAATCQRGWEPSCAHIRAHRMGLPSRNLSTRSARRREVPFGLSIRKRLGNRRLCG